LHGARPRWMNWMEVDEHVGDGARAARGRPSTAVSETCGEKESLLNTAARLTRVRHGTGSDPPPRRARLLKGGATWSVPLSPRR
jgi:hypothetical protein